VTASDHTATQRLGASGGRAGGGMQSTVPGGVSRVTPGGESAAAVAAHDYAMRGHVDGPTDVNSHRLPADHTAIANCTS